MLTTLRKLVRTKVSATVGIVRKIGWRKNPWLLYHREKRALFFDYCTRFANKNISSPFIFRFDSHGNVGFGNWKKVPDRIKEREDSHRAVARAAAIHNQISSEVFESANFSQQEKRQEGLVAHLETLRVLLRQGAMVKRVGHISTIVLVNI